MDAEAQDADRGLLGAGIMSGTTAGTPPQKLMLNVPLVTLT